MTRSAALAAVLLLATPAAARELWSSASGDQRLELRLTAREIVTGTHGTDADAFASAAAANPAQCLLAATFPDCPAWDLAGDAGVVQSLTRLRFEIDLQLHPALSARVAYDQQLVAGQLDTLAASSSEALGIDTFQLFDADDVILERESVLWSQRLYRASVRLDTRWLEAEVGRQRIAWGVGRLWNPIDRLSAIPPLAIEGDEVPGVDAVDLRLRLSGFTYLEGVWAPGSSHAERTAAGRVHGVALDTDYSLLGGRFGETWVAGFDVARNLGDAAVRLEVVWTDPDLTVFPVGAPAPSELPSYWQLVGSIDLNVDVGSGLYVLVEQLWNQNALGFGSGDAGPALAFFESTPVAPPGTPPGVPGPFVTFASGNAFGGSRVVTFAEHLTGVQLGYDVVPEVRAELLTLVDWVGGSVAVAPSVAYSPLAALDVRVGAQLFAGPKRSEFGDRQHLGFLLLDLYF